MSVAERATREQRLANLAATVERCRACEIGSIRRNSVFGEGDACAKLLVIGEGPGETEDQLGRPFVGRAGQLLDKMLLAIGLQRDDVFIANTVKCRPTFDDGVRLRNRPPDPVEMANCRPYLDEQIEILAPGVILCLGAPSAKSFLGPRFSITKQRGTWFEGPRGIPLIATFHPAYILRLTGGEINATKRLVWNDLKAVAAKLAEPALRQAQGDMIQGNIALHHHPKRPGDMIEGNAANNAPLGSCHPEPVEGQHGSDYPPSDVQPTLFE